MVISQRYSVLCRAGQMRTCFTRVCAARAGVGRVRLLAGPLAILLRDRPAASGAHVPCPADLAGAAHGATGARTGARPDPLRPRDSGVHALRRARPSAMIDDAQMANSASIPCMPSMSETSPPWCRSCSSTCQTTQARDASPPSSSGIASRMSSGLQRVRQAAMNRQV